MGKRKDEETGLAGDSNAHIHTELERLGAALNDRDWARTMHHWERLKTALDARLPAEGRRCLYPNYRCHDCGTPYKATGSPNVCTAFERVCHNCGHEYESRWLGKAHTYQARREKQDRTCPRCLVVRLECGVERRLCQRYALANGRCHLHGGRATAQAYTVTTAKSGRRSLIWQRQELARWYADAMAADEEEMMNLGDEIALVDVRINQVLADIENMAAEAITTDQILERLEALELVDDAKQLKKGIGELMGEIAKLRNQDIAWAAVGDWIERRRKLVDTESERKARQDAMLSFEQAVQMIRFLQQAFVITIENLVRDPALQKKLKAEHSKHVRALLGTDSGEAMALVQRNEPQVVEAEFTVLDPEDDD